MRFIVTSSPVNQGIFCYEDVAHKEGIFSFEFSLNQCLISKHSTLFLFFWLGNFSIIWIGGIFFNQLFLICFEITTYSMNMINFELVHRINMQRG